MVHLMDESFIILLLPGDKEGLAVSSIYFEMRFMRHDFSNSLASDIISRNSDRIIGRDL